MGRMAPGHLKLKADSALLIATPASHPTAWKLIPDRGKGAFIQHYNGAIEG